MKLLNFTIIKITLCLIVGILFAHSFEFSSAYTLPTTLSFIISLSALLIVEKGRLVKSFLFGTVTILTFIAIGIFTYQTHDQKKFKHHYTQPIDSAINYNATITFRIREVVKPGVNHEKYIIDILKVNDQVLSGKTLLNVKKDSLFKAFKVDDVLATVSPLTDLNRPLNPNQFDYKAYLENQHIYHQIFADNTQLLAIPSDVRTVFGYAAQLRTRINHQLKLYHLKRDELALINALLLGQRQDISTEILNSYSKAGAMHILAVSGLHVGIVLLLLNSLFKPMEYLRHGKFMKIIVIVVILWGFAIVAGLSASVTRAVTMFSIVAIGMNLKRPSNIFNTLAISMFFLLLFKPLFLFDVGFQMSYLAVIAIVTFQPLMVRLWQPKFKPVKTLWGIFTITMAAQLGVMPISLFYFHQFPGLFFVSNLIIIPFLGVILGMGILVILMALITILPFWVAAVYGGMISIMTSFVRWIALQEQFIFSDIPFTKLQVLTSYFVIISFFVLFKKPNFKRLAVAMLCIMSFQTALIFEKQKLQTVEMIVFHKSKYSLIGIKNNNTFAISHNFDSVTNDKDHSIRNYKLGNAITAVTQDTVENIYLFNNKKFLIIDSLGIYKVPHLNPDFIILRNSPRINLMRLLDSIKPERIIADGSNFKSYLQRWEATCIKQKIPFHMTGREGAFVLKKE